MKIFKDQSPETTATVVSVAYRLWLPLLINRVLNLTKLKSIIFDQPVNIPVDSIFYEKSHYCYRLFIIYTSRDHEKILYKKANSSLLKKINIEGKKIAK